MVVVPEDTPDTVPEVTVATPMLLLLHEPPAGVQERNIAEPRHVTPAPVIGPGNAFTVTLILVEHPPASE